MDKKPLIVVSLCAVILLVVASLGNVVGYQTVQSSQQNFIKERINQKELLFQTICDISNNKEIQRIILKSQISRGISPPSESPVVTKNQIKMMYFLGVLLSRYISKSRIQSIIQQYKLINPQMRQEISAVIEEDSTLKKEIIQLQNSECDCENKNTTEWRFPVICTTLYILMIAFLYAYLILTTIFNGPIIHIFIEYLFLMMTVISPIAQDLNCPMPDFYPW